MGKDSLDRHIKDQLYNHKTPTDPEMIWNNIQKAKGTAGTSLSFLYWLIPVLIIGLVSVGFLMFNQPGNDAITQDAHSTAIVSSPTSTEEEKSANTPVKTEDDSDLEKSNTDNLSSISANSIQNLKESKSQNSKYSSATTSSFESKKSKASLKDENKNSNKTKTEISLQQDYSKTNSNPSKIFENDMPSDNQSETDGPSNYGSNFEVNNTIEKSIEIASQENQIKRSLLDISGISSKESFLTSLVLDESAFNNLKYDFSKRALFSYRNDWGFSIGAHGFYGLTDKKLSTTDVESTTYLSNRKRTESSLEATGFGVDLKASKWDNFYIKAGLAYNQINERFDLMESRDTSYIANDQVIRIVVNANGDSIPELGPGLVTESYFFQKRIHNNYRFIDFPVVIGFEYNTGALGYFIEAGASMNLMFSRKGEIYGPDELSYDLDTDSQNYFKSNAGLSLIGGFGISYRLSDYLSFSTQSNLKFQLSSVNASANPIDQKYVVVGLQAGLRFHLGQ